MLTNEIAKLTSDLNITPQKNLTTWGAQKNRKIGLQMNPWGEPLKATRVTSIAYGETKDTTKITTVYHLMKQVTTNGISRNKISQNRI